MQNIINNILIKTVAIWIILVLSGYTDNAWSKDCKKAVPVLEGESADCTGIIYPENLVKEHMLLRIKTDELSEKLALTKTDCKEKLSICKNYLSEADNQMQKINNPPFWKTPVFGFISGVIITVVSAYSISTL